MTIPSSQSLIFEVKSNGSELAFIRVLRLGLDNFAFGRLRTSSDFFGSPRSYSGIFGNDRVVFKKSQHSQDKNLTLISQKKLTGILFCCAVFYNFDLIMVYNVYNLSLIHISEPTRRLLSRMPSSA